MDQKEFAKVMQESAQEAVEYSEVTFDITLNGQLESVIFVEDILEKLADQNVSNPFNDEEIFTLCYLFGGYLGELFISNYGGEWFYQEETKDEPPQVFIKKDDTSYAFPSFVYHRLQNKEEFNVSEYFYKIQQVHS